MKPILVTGATGFIGRHLALRLVDQGKPVRLLVRDPQRLDPRLRQSAQIYPGDLTLRDSLLAPTRGISGVFHCAANVHTWDQRAAYWAANVDGLGNLLDALQNSGSMPNFFLHFSSVDVYGFPEAPAREQDPLPATTGFGYGDSKQAGEALLRDRAAALSLPYSILRPCNVMGEGSPFVERIGTELRSGLMLLVDGGRADCGYLDVKNLVDVALWLVENPRTAGETYNLRDPMSLSWQRFVADLRRALKGKGIVLRLPYGVAMAAGYAMSAPYSAFGLRSEPLLHPLVVKIFGRTCGHDIDKIRSAGAPLGRVTYEKSLEGAVTAFLRGR
ncbi:NAD-dependent epimerase/dehydratase family protein [Acidithiobacillus caldus]|uniref:Dihydroflavonol-4-reductase n=1 Tax=Acidithiobacillus caldus (strain ATCC 51756 / DSM 8584 / KU) TaxID=637389 RepID=A0A059ZYB1_ACICK|nr:NAD(P)-dependent oxidoreductase [Acidithiobacillus caldus]AIA54897.1 Dihydroflavonol-4-reductase [Acidithiobacillus caldus ATCC 51756]MBU2728743.1 NAD(P)-dependent oxidoreductase [Acidithiobacillus caldus]MBU2736299.1 NAD(P)-dependent oxidoreductase [Acidithiobacillus caldus ATCC 51756]MBU2744765.1 NAD(P)-dependent oxidoreductase [Acidithiobacillus caldus]MBU2780291.1 NAD(P)-dependent oxidoreductase [Acidithiobacillus caldus]